MPDHAISENTVSEHSSAPPSSLLEIRDLSIYFSVFRGEAKVIDGMNLTVDEGETVVLAGETGCGKSLTAKAILRVIPIPPARIVSGRALFRGRDLLQIDETELQEIKGREIAVIPQDPMTALNPVYTVEDQMLTMMVWQGHEEVTARDWLKLTLDRNLKKELRKKTLDMLNSLRIPSPELVLKRYPIELSGGMRQRVLIAMALLKGPRLLIADEPGTALDVTVQEKIIRLLKERIRTENLSTLYITHDLGTARKLADRIAIMYAGRVIEFGSVTDVFNDPLHPYTAGLLRSLPKLRGGIGEGIPGMVPDYVNPPSGCRFHPRCEHGTPVCNQIRPEMVEAASGHFVECGLHPG
jgi:oligopeptide/dipeptide ABC transporter ATP-binding protein